MAKLKKERKKGKERHIPAKGKVADEIKNILQTRWKVESQEELAALVLRRLRKENKTFSLSPIRVKRLALLIPEIEVKAKTKKNHKLQKIEACPVCESEILPLNVKNLLNKQITIGYKCTSCGYESDLEAFVPMKYSFVWKP
jgi:DNA-directed RNA polymerase subunit M/transcription elongation factor TFIIS